jgi:hypothetical protein
MGATIFRKNKEYIAFCYYDKYYSDDDRSTRSIIASEFEFMNKNLASDNWRLLDLKQLQINCNEHLKYLLLYDEYLSLQVDAEGELSYNKDGFQLYGKIFQSLAEVKRALKLKAFA